MTRQLRRQVCTRLTCVLILATAGCGNRPDTVVIGSKNFTEQILLGEIAAQQIERKTAVRVQRKLGLGGTLLAHEALVQGQLDLYPEYTGTAMTAVLKQTGSSDPAKSYMQVKDAYRNRFHLIWLPPLGFNDTFAMVVRSDDARRLTQPSLSAANARSWRLGVGYEFLTRPDGLSRLDRVYRMRWSDAPRTMDLGLLYQALTGRQIDMAAANSTDGLLTESKYAVLADDRAAFPAYNACFVARQAALEAHRDVEMALTLLAGRISDAQMREMNRAVDVSHVPVEKVARQFLATQP